MPTGPNREHGSEYDPDYQRRLDEQMDLATKDLDAAFTPIRDHVVLYFALLPLAAGVFVVLSAARPFYAIARWRQSRRSA